MTEKRYTIFGEWHKNYVIDEIRDNTGEYVTIGKVVDLLNENEQLKQTISDWNGSYDELYEEVKRLEKENENFKKALRIVYSTKLTEPTKHTIEQIAKHCGVDLE